MVRRFRSASLRPLVPVSRDLATTPDLDMEALKNFSELFAHFRHSDHLLTAFNLFLLEHGNPVDQHALHFLQELREYSSLPPEVQQGKAQTLYHTYLAIDQESGTGQIVPSPTYDPTVESKLLEAAKIIGRGLLSWNKQMGPTLFGELSILFHTRLNTRYFNQGAQVPFDQSAQAKAIKEMKGVSNLPSITRSGFNAAIYKALPARLPAVTYATKISLGNELFNGLQDLVGANLYASGSNPSTHFIDRKTTLITRLALQQTPTFQAVIKRLSAAYLELPALFRAHEGTKGDSLQLWQEVRYLLRYDPKSPLTPQRLYKEIGKVRSSTEIKSLLGKEGLEALKELAGFEFNKWLEKGVAHEIWCALNRREVGSRVVLWDSPCAVNNRGIGTEGENPKVLSELTFRQLFDETLFTNNVPQFGLFAVNGVKVGTDQHRKRLAQLPQEWRALVIDALMRASWPSRIKKEALERATTDHTSKGLLKDYPWLIALFSCHAKFQDTVDIEVWDGKKGWGQLREIQGIDLKRPEGAQPTYDIVVQSKQVAVTIVEFYAMVSGPTEVARFDLHKTLTFGFHKSTYDGGCARIRNLQLQPTDTNFWERKAILDALGAVNQFPLKLLDTSIQARDSVEFRRSYYGADDA